MISILIVEPDKYPYEADVTDDLKTYQSIVGGLIECIQIGDGVDVVCNEEGKLLGLELNRTLWGVGIPDVVCGTFFIIGVDYETGEFKSLTNEQRAEYKRLFRL